MARGDQVVNILASALGQVLLSGAGQEQKELLNSAATDIASVPAFEVLVQSLEVNEVGPVLTVVLPLSSPARSIGLLKERCPVCTKPLVGLLVPVDIFIRHRPSCTVGAMIKLQLLRSDLAGALN